MPWQARYGRRSITEGESFFVLTSRFWEWGILKSEKMYQPTYLAASASTSRLQPGLFTIILLSLLTYAVPSD